MNGLLAKKFSTSPLVYYAGLYAAAAAALKLVSFGLFMWLARSLSVPEYGSWGLYYALQTGITTFGLVGIVESVIGLWRDHRLPEDQLRLAGGANTVLLFNTAAMALITAVLTWCFVPPAERSLATGITVFVSGSMLAFAALQAQILRLQEKHFAALGFNFLVPLAGLGGSALAFTWEHSIRAFFCGASAGLALALGCARLAGAGCYSLTCERAHWRPIVQRLIPFLTITLLGWVSGYGNTYIIKSFFNETEVARFTLLFMLAAVLQLIASALNQVWAPHFYRMTREAQPAEVMQHSGRFLSRQGIALGFTGAALLAAYPWLTRQLGGNLQSYQSLNDELLLLVLYYVVSIPWWHCQNYFLAHDEGQLMMRMNLSVSAVGLAVLGLAMWAWGPWGFYIGFFSQMVLRSAGAVLVAKRRWPMVVGYGGMLAGSIITLIGFFASKSGRGHF